MSYVSKALQLWEMPVNVWFVLNDEGDSVQLDYLLTFFTLVFSFIGVLKIDKRSVYNYLRKVEQKKKQAEKKVCLVIKDVMQCYR